MNPVQFRKLLRRQRRTKVGITVLDDANDFGTQTRRVAAVTRPTAPARDQRLRTMLAVCLRQPKYLTPTNPHQPRRLGDPDPAICQIVQYAHPVDLNPAHRNHRHRPNTPQLKLWRVTSLSGRTVTSLSGVYMVSARKSRYGIFYP